MVENSMKVRHLLFCDRTDITTLTNLGSGKVKVSTMAL